MKKTKVTTILLFVFIIVSALTYLNYDKILNYFSNRQWELADVVEKIEMENYLDTFCTGSNFFVVNSGGIKGYSETAKEVLKKDISFKDVISSSAGDYAVVVDKSSANVVVINKSEMVWETTISNATILGASINKNGYCAIIYSQPGYKSLIRVFSSTGKELFTNYLASTYAVDVDISNDNKTLAIAEIDANGVSLASGIKLIDIQTVSNDKVEKYDFENEEIISDIEYDENNELIILTDLNISILKNNKISELINFKDENIILADISNHKDIVAVKVVEESLFNTKCEVCVYDFKEGKNAKTYEIDENPNSIVTCNDIIAVDVGDKVIFLNSSANFLKKCEYKGQLKNVELFNNEKMAVLIFRDTAEFINIGGI